MKRGFGPVRSALTVWTLMIQVKGIKMKQYIIAIGLVLAVLLAGCKLAGNDFIGCSAAYDLAKSGLANLKKLEVLEGSSQIIADYKRKQNKHLARYGCTERI